MNKEKRKHYVDFTTHAKICEHNYWRLLRLMPNILTSEKNKTYWSYSFGNKASLSLSLELLKSHKYTQTILVTYARSSQSRENDVADSSRSKVSLMMAVRIYRDAKTAEVVDNKTFKQLAGHYGYPNVKMYQEDEKLQRNKFLKMLLVSCLETGIVVGDLLSNYSCEN